MLANANASAESRGIFVRDLLGCDPLHYGNGEITRSFENSKTYIILKGSARPGLDYKLYLMSKYVDTKAGERLSRPKIACERYQGV